MTEQPREQRGISRRTIAKGAAWAVPALPIVAATPAYAKSGGPPTIELCGACKQPGASCAPQNKGYTFVVSVTNTTGETIYVYPTLNEEPNPDVPGDTLNPRFEITEANDDDVTFTYFTAREYLVDPVTGPYVGDFLSEAEAIQPGDTLSIIIDAGTNSNSAFLVISGYLYMAWGHEPTPGGDTDHPFAPAPPPAVAGGTVGEAWIDLSFTDVSFTSCNGTPYVNCLPTGC